MRNRISMYPCLTVLIMLLLARCDTANLNNPFSNRTMEFSMSCRKNETGHFMTDFSLKKTSPELPKNWRLHLDHGVLEYGGIQTFHLRGVIVTNPPVPAGYELFPGIGYYKFHKTALAFDAASALCAAEGGHLVIINSEAESGVIKALFEANKGTDSWAWAGFHDRLKEGEFVTIFGQPLGSTGFYTWFSPAEPNGGTKENCGSVQANGLLNDKSCNSKIPAICEFDLSWIDS